MTFLKNYFNNRNNKNNGNEDHPSTGNIIKEEKEDPILPKERSIDDDDDDKVSNITMKDDPSTNKEPISIRRNNSWRKENDSISWLSKYAPNSIEDIISNKGRYQQLEKWLLDKKLALLKAKIKQFSKDPYLSMVDKKNNIDEVKRIYLDTFPPDRMEERRICMDTPTNIDKDNKKIQPACAFIHGPVGCGKSTSVVVALKSTGFKIKYIDSSTLLSGSMDLRKEIYNAVFNNKISMKNIFSAVVIEDMDSLFEIYSQQKFSDDKEDSKKRKRNRKEEGEGGLKVEEQESIHLQGLFSLLNILRFDSIPVIFISSNQKHKILRNLASHCLSLSWISPSISEITYLARKIMIFEKFEVNNISTLVHSSNGDVRKMINKLYMEKKLMDFNNKNKEATSHEESKTIFTIKLKDEKEEDKVIESHHLSFLQKIKEYITTFTTSYPDSKDLFFKDDNQSSCRIDLLYEPSIKRVDLIRREKEIWDQFMKIIYQYENKKKKKVRSLFPPPSRIISLDERIFEYYQRLSRPRSKSISRDYDYMNSEDDLFGDNFQMATRLLFSDIRNRHRRKEIEVDRKNPIDHLMDIFSSDPILMNDMIFEHYPLSIVDQQVDDYTSMDHVSSFLDNFSMLDCASQTSGFKWMENESLICLNSILPSLYNKNRNRQDEKKVTWPTHLTYSKEDSIRRRQVKYLQKKLPPVGIFIPMDCMYFYLQWWRSRLKIYPSLSEEDKRRWLLEIYNRKIDEEELDLLRNEDIFLTPLHSSSNNNNRNRPNLIDVGSGSSSLLYRLRSIYVASKISLSPVNKKKKSKKQKTCIPLSDFTL